ncbi:MAG: ATP-binding protein [Sedimentisphaerales bacterium]|nr:ATP-binding protein [Sedimentisphaerales bacterium]
MASEAPIRSSIVLESQPSSLAGPCRKILTALEERGFSQDDTFAVHLALEEAFLNAVKHGNKMDPGKKVTLEFRVDEEKIEINMADEGPGFNPRDIPDPRTGENLYRPEGRGLLLIHAYMHLAEYNEQGNRLRMIRYKNKPVPERGNPA